MTPGLPHPAPDVALIVGKLWPDDPVPDRFEAEAADRGFFCARIDLLRDALNLLHADPVLGSRHTVVFLAFQRGEQAHVEQDLESLQQARPGAKVLVYGSSAFAEAGELAVKCAHKNACDFLVSGIYPNEFVNEHVLRFLECAMGGKAIYGSFPIMRSIQVPKGSQVFVATAYHDPPLADCYRAVLPAIRALGLDPLLSKDEIGLGLMLQKICDQIDGSKLLVANISPLEPGRHNPNVFLELGFAVGRPIPVILVNRSGQQPVPVDIQGIERREYLHSPDLALQLYFGLKDCVA